VPGGASNAPSTTANPRRAGRAETRTPPSFISVQIGSSPRHLDPAYRPVGPGDICHRLGNLRQGKVPAFREEARNWPSS
jgi:hypothetical protein